MGQVKNMLIEYIECMIAAGSHHTFEELQDLVMVDGSAEKAAFRVRLVQRLNHFAPLLGVQWRSLSLGTARTRWGSARADGSIRLNVGLIRVAPALVDYVVVHELSHLREMNHSPRFWAIVASVLPNHADLRKLLKRESIT